MAFTAADWATITRRCAHCGISKSWRDYNHGPYWVPPIFQGRDGQQTCERCFLNNRDRK